jgi:phosphatidylserine synthase
MENPRFEEENSSTAPNTFRRILAALCLAPYALLGWLRFSQGLAYRDYLSELKIWPGPQYVIFSGLAIGIGFSLLLLMLLLHVRIAPPLARMICMLFLGWLWVDHIWLGTREAFHYQLAVNALVSIVTLLIAFVLVRGRDYLKEEN